MTSGDRRLDAPAGAEEASRASFTFAVAPGSYSLRLAVADERGRRGALEHPVRARLVESNGLRLSDLLLGDPSAPRGRQLRPFPTTAVDQVSAVVEVEDVGAAGGEPVVSFEVAASEDGPPLVRAAAHTTREAARVTADAVVPIGPLAAGEYVMRATVQRAGSAAVASRRFRYAPKARAATATAGPGRSASGLIEKLDAYLAGYASSLGAVVAREDYVQREHEEGRRTERRLVSDLLMARLPGQPWVAYRDVAEADGRAVRGRGRRLERLLREDPAGALRQARRFADEGARYNLGRFPRNFNAPTTALALLDPGDRRRVAIERLDDRDDGGRRLAQVRVREKEAGVLVRTRRSEPVRSEAVFSVDPETGAIVRSRLVVDHPLVRATIEVDYREDPGLGLRVPAEMREDYRRPPSVQFDRIEGRYRVDGVATYRDFVRPAVSIEVLGAEAAGPP